MLLQKTLERQYLIVFQGSVCTMNKKGKGSVFFLPCKKKIRINILFFYLIKKEKKNLSQ